MDQTALRINFMYIYRLVLACELTRGSIAEVCLVFTLNQSSDRSSFTRTSLNGACYFLFVQAYYRNSYK